LPQLPESPELAESPELPKLSSGSISRSLRQSPGAVNFWQFRRFCQLWQFRVGRRLDNASSRSFV
jgi:hypothetical protein